MFPEMTAQDVIDIIHLFEENHVDVCLDGGWGVDALLGRVSGVSDFRIRAKR